MTENMPYVDGFVIAIPKKNLEDYKQMAAKGRDIWMKHGAIDYKECVGNDMTPSMGDMGEEAGQMGTFPQLINAKDDEVVVFSYIVFKSREHRDEVNAKVMQDPEMSPEAFKDKAMPFEMNRAYYGGFETIVSA